MSSLALYSRVFVFWRENGVSIHHSWVSYSGISTCFTMWGIKQAWLVFYITFYYTCMQSGDAAIYNGVFPIDSNKSPLRKYVVPSPCCPIPFPPHSSPLSLTHTHTHTLTDTCVALEHEILLHPRYFGPNLLETVKKKLFTEVEGTCTGKWECESFLAYNAGRPDLYPGCPAVWYSTRVLWGCFSVQIPDNAMSLGMVLWLPWQQ